MEFKLIVAGGRDFGNYALLESELMKLADGEYKHKLVSIVSGCARGADALGITFAIKHGVQIYEFPADWASFGKAAGFRRNTQMAQFADGLLAFWDEVSPGTAHMIKTMEALRKPVHIVKYKTGPFIGPHRVIRGL